MLRPSLTQNCKATFHTALQAQPSHLMVRHWKAFMSHQIKYSMARFCFKGNFECFCLIMSLYTFKSSFNLCFIITDDDDYITVLALWFCIIHMDFLRLRNISFRQKLWFHWWFGMCGPTYQRHWHSLQECQSGQECLPGFGQSGGAWW